MSTSPQLPFKASTVASSPDDAKRKSCACRGLLLLVVCAGVIFRSVQYAWRTSLWHDEALVTLNVMHRTYAQLLRPLDYTQAAPPLFLWIERWIYLHWGFGEDQLRLVAALRHRLSRALRMGGLAEVSRACCGGGGRDLCVLRQADLALG